MSSKTKTVPYIIIVSIIAILAIGGWFSWKRYSPTTDQKSRSTANTSNKINSVNYDPPTTAQKTAGEAAKVGAQRSSTVPNSSITLQDQKGTVNISRAIQTNYNGVAMVSLRTTVTGLTTGTCTATFSRTGQNSIEQKTDVISSANYYSCAPVDVAVSSFSESGAWNVKVAVTNSSNSVVSNTETGSVQVQK